jgi:hypothetical protein
MRNLRRRRVTADGSRRTVWFFRNVLAARQTEMKCRGEEWFRALRVRGTGAWRVNARVPDVNRNRQWQTPQER